MSRNVPARDVLCRGTFLLATEYVAERSCSRRLMSRNVPARDRICRGTFLLATEYSTKQLCKPTVMSCAARHACMIFMEYDMLDVYANDLFYLPHEKFSLALLTKLSTYLHAGGPVELCHQLMLRCFR